MNHSVITMLRLLTVVRHYKRGFYNGSFLKCNERKMVSDLSSVNRYKQETSTQINTLRTTQKRTKTGNVQIIKSLNEPGI